MPSPTETLILTRLETLIERGQGIQKAAKTCTFVKKEWGLNETRTERVTEYPEQASRIWRGNFTTVTENVLEKNTALWKQAEKLLGYGTGPSFIDHGIDFLISLKEDISLGLLRRAEQHIEAAATVDYLEIAERLFTEAGPDTHRHIAAAVIAGAVFEHGLRALALRQNLQVVSPEGKPLMLNGLIEAVRKANVVTELDAKRMRAWAGIRNAAAHGRFAEVTEAMAKELIAGTTGFLADHQ